MKAPKKEYVAQLQMGAKLSLGKIRSAVQSKHGKMKGERKSEIDRLAGVAEDALAEMETWLD